MNTTIRNIEINSRAHIILGLLEDLSLNERPDLSEYLEELTKLFYTLREKYIQSGTDEMGANELAMEDVKSYVLSVDEE